MKKLVFTLAALALATGAHANLVTNGGFESNTGNGQIAYNTSATGWSAPAPNDSYVFLYNAGPGTSGTTADTTGANGEYGNVGIWGPGNGSANGLTLSPDGGAFLGSDPDFQDGPISQTINGLTAGQKYVVTFDWAGAQQSGFRGLTTEGWQVSLGSGPSQSTALLPNADQGFTGWQTSSFTFTADGTSDVLSFLALGTGGSGEPPFSLLDGVSMTGVPEPATWALMIGGFAMMGVGLRRRRTAPAAV